MTTLKLLNKDRLGGLLFIAFGAVALGMGLTYDIGTLQHMGAGFVPVAIGVLMIVVGAAIMLTAATAGGDAAPVPPLPTAHAPAGHGPEWRGWTCIVGGVAAFVVLGNYGGLVPASFASVFISALGDRDNSVRSAAVLAALVTVFGTAVFYYGLHLQLALFQWG